jgi:hypothetical protein
MGSGVESCDFERLSSPHERFQNQNHDDKSALQGGPKVWFA